MDWMTGGQAAVTALAAHGVEVVFGIPGSHNLEIYRHLTAAGIRHVVCRHEQGAGYAADGYARVAGRPGVIVTTSGPGILNAAAALASAYGDSVPVLAITPGPPRGTERLDRGWMHEVKDQRAALDAIVDRAVRCESPQAVADAVGDVFAGWAATRTRPVVLEIPVDVLAEAGPVGPIGVRPAPAAPIAPDDALVRAAGVLDAAATPVVVAGGGAIRATASVRALAERLGAPVVETQRGKGVLPAGHELAVGPSLGTTAGRALVRAADAVLVVGTELSDAEAGGEPLACTGTVIRVDVSPAQLHKNLPADLPLLGDAGRVLDRLAALVQPAGDDSGATRARQAADAVAAELDDVLAPHRWIHDALVKVLPAGAVLTGDSSQVTYKGTIHLWPAPAPDRVLAPSGFATLGYAVPAAVGATLAGPGVPVVAVLGDGALMFSVQELRTAADLGRPLPVVVADNGGYAEIAEEMDATGIPRLGVDLPPPDYPALAAAMGAAYAAVTDAATLADALAAALDHPGPTLILARS